ncbi:MAG TPA: hypothetical protein VK327_11630, partial [Candidatus Paceibacterota bacterium]|nr:hypothetical protein [Candidatus Paceibacterota bacterium]
ANRNAEDRAAQIPLWLAEGLSRELLATERVETLIPPPRTKDNGLSLTRVLVEQRRTDPLAYTLTVLRAHAPLTFEQLSWPDEKSLSGEPFETFSASAHLFIRQLLQMENGKTHLRETLDQLPRNFNWQFALLSGFKASFKTQLDVEKWWALQLVQFTGRDLSQAWTHDITWTKLDQILLAPMETRSSPAELPRHTDITLQAIIYNWDGFNQRKAIEQKLHELDLLRPFAAQSLISLVDDYRQLLGRYLQKQNFSGSFFGLRKQTGPIRNRLANETVKELNALDAKRMALKSPPPQPATETAATSPNGK